MNLKSTSVFAGLIAGSALALSTLPAQAAFTVGGVTFNDNGSFTIGNAPTTINFTFLESRGFYRSSFGIYNSNDPTQTPVQTLFTENAPGYDLNSSDANGDWLGTQGKTVNPFITSYTFAQNATYFFGLDSSPQGGVTFTTASGNFQSGVPLGTINSTIDPYTAPTTTGAPNQAFNSNADFYTRSTRGPSSGGGQFSTIDTSSFDFFTAINDTATIDKDVQDFIVGATIVPTNRTVPEPATLAGLGLVAGAMTMLRRRKGSQVS